MTTETKDTSVEGAAAVLIPLEMLKKSPRNARQTAHTAEAIEALAASIHAKGMLQNLVVEPELDKEGQETGYYYVTAGEGRRLAQMLRVRRRQIKKTELVRCVVDTTNDARELSLDENITRSSMHPADQFEAFRALADNNGWGAEEIGARFGVSPAVVRQRMRLGAVSPELMQKYRDGDLTLEQLMAFAVTEDHERQKQVYELIQEGWNKQPNLIRRLMTEAHVAAHDRRAVLVGLDAYQAAGGVVTRDLFSEDGGGYLEDVSLLDRMVTEKLAEVAEELTADGWAWAEVHVDFPYGHGLRHIYPTHFDLPAKDAKRLEKLRAEYAKIEERYEGWDEEDEYSEEDQARMEALEAEIGELAAREHAYTPEQKSSAGVIVSLDPDGTPRVEPGLVRPEAGQRGDDSPLADDEEEDGDGQVTFIGAAREGRSEGEAPTKQPGRLSDALVRDLTSHRTLALRRVLGDQPDVALVALTHVLAEQVFYSYTRTSCLEIRMNPPSLGRGESGLAESAAGRAIAERHEAWERQLPENRDGLWAFIAGLKQDRQLALLAHCSASTVDAIEQKWDGRDRKPTAADRLAEALSFNMAEHWEATAHGYFSRVSKASILEAVREGASEEDATLMAPMQKHGMAEAAERKLAGKGWVPRLLRTPVAVDEAGAEEPLPEAA